MYVIYAQIAKTQKVHTIVFVTKDILELEKSVKVKTSCSSLF